MKQLLLATLLCLACSGEVSEPIGESQQALSNCQIISWSVSDQGVIGAPGLRIFYWRAMNNGSVACPYKTQVEVFVAGGGTVQGTIFSGAALDPYDPSGQTRAHSQTLPVGVGCTYKIWYKYKPAYPSGSESWFLDGTYFC